MTDSYLLRQEQCPKCAENGKDTKEDNLSIYNDGHSYCYGCGYYKSGSAIVRFMSKKEHNELTKHHVYLPSDCNIEYPQRALQWIEQYELNRNDLLANNVVWSERKERLYFPVYGSEGLLAYQGRYMGSGLDQKRWWGQGDFKNIFALFGRQGRSLALVEDVVSAIKLSRITQSLWLSGNHVGEDRWKRIFKLIPRGLPCIIWLDPDMYTQSVKQSRLGASYGVNTRSILSSKDPKEHSFVEIKELLNEVS